MSYFRNLKEPKKGFENLEVILYSGKGGASLKHSVVSRNGLLFDRMCNSFPFHIVPKDGYFANYGYFDSKDRRRFVRYIDESKTLTFENGYWNYSN